MRRGACDGTTGLDFQRSGAAGSSSSRPRGRRQPQPSPHAGGFWERDLLTGDWGGVRTDWENHGIQLGANYIGEVLGDPSGGVRRGTIYEGRLELYLTADLEKAVGWSGATFHVNETVAFRQLRDACAIGHPALAEATSAERAQILAERRDFTFSSPEKLAALYAAAGISNDRRVITYCGTGYAAACGMLALKLLGHGDVRLYDGSWAEWSADPSLPAEISGDGEAQQSKT